MIANLGDHLIIHLAAPQQLECLAEVVRASRVCSRKRCAIDNLPDLRLNLRYGTAPTLHQPSVEALRFPGYSIVGSPRGGIAGVEQTPAHQVIYRTTIDAVETARGTLAGEDQVQTPT